MFSLFPNPVLNDRVFDYLLTSMAVALAEDVRSSFRFVGYLNGHHQEWLGATTMDRHGVVAFNFTTLWLRSVGCRPNPCTWWNTKPSDD